MPTYEYRCSNCGHQLEAVQSFSDEALTECPECGRPDLRKVFGNVGVVFKGSGFYRNDSRNDRSAKGSGSAGAKGADSGTGASDSSSTSDGTTKKSDGAKKSSDGSGSGSSGATPSPAAPSSSAPASKK